MLYMLFNTCLSTYVCVYVCIEISGVFPLLGSSVANEWGMVHVGSCCAGSALGLEAGCGAGVSRQKSTLNAERIDHLSWCAGKALGIVFSDAAKSLQPMFLWGFWVRNAAGLCAPPLSIPFIFHPCPITPSKALKQVF